MKKIIWLLSFIAVVKCCAIDIEAKQTRKMSITIAGIGNDTDDLRQLCETIQNDLSFPGQFKTEIIRLLKLDSKNEILALQEKGPLLLSITDKVHENAVEWRLYNTKTANMILGKKMAKQGASVREWGHALSNRVLEALTERSGFFSSKLVYCKEGTEKNKTQICISDFDGKHEVVIADPKTLAIAPRWNGNTAHPSVLYSEYTASNMRLMSVDPRRRFHAQVATSFDGLNMLPAFSEDGKEVVLCLSVEGSSQIYRYHYNKRKKRPEYVRLTHNEGTNLSPVVLNDGRIAFCSDYETGRPQIYVMDRDGENVKRISTGGSCTSPSYCAANNKLVYSRLVESVSQLLVYDFKTESTTQITRDLAHKEEASWSPCGNYLVFSVADAKTKRLAVLNLLTNTRNFITGSTHRYSYPHWSGSNIQLPVFA